MSRKRTKLIGTAAIASIAMGSLMIPQAQAQDANEPATSIVKSDKTTKDAAPIEKKDQAKPTPSKNQAKPTPSKDTKPTEEKDQKNPAPSKEAAPTENKDQAQDNKDKAPEEKQANKLGLTPQVVKAGETVTFTPDAKLLKQEIEVFSADTSKLTKGWMVEVNPKTGETKVTAPKEATPGESVTFNLRATLKDRSTVSAPATVSIHGMKDEVQPTYESKQVTPGELVTLEQATKNLPEGTKFGLPENMPEDFYAGWEIAVDPATGAITAKAPKDAKHDITVEVPVVATYPDGTFETVTAKVTTPPEKNKDENKENEKKTSTDVTYTVSEVTPGGTITLKQATEDLAQGAKFSIPANFTIPEGWQITVDPVTGDITAVAPKEATPGEVLDIPVIAVFPDGSTTSAVAKLGVMAEVEQETGMAANHAPAYAALQIAPGEKKEVSQTGDKAIPKGTTFKIDEKFVAPAAWMVSVDSATGKVTIEAPATIENGQTVEVPVVTTYPDGTTDTANVFATVIGSPKGADGATDGNPTDNKKPSDDKDVKDKDNKGKKDKNSPAAPTLDPQAKDKNAKDTKGKDADKADKNNVSEDRGQSRLGKFFSNFWSSPTTGKTVEGVADYMVADRLARAAESHSTPLAPKTAKGGPAVHTGGQIER